MTQINRLNIRVYGILSNPKQEVLVVHETINDFHFTKFPGGGLELGEGPEDCLIRECLEEMKLEAQIDRHFYTTGFFQPSAFKATDQLIAIYYLLKPVTSNILFADHIEISPGKTETMKFEWIPKHLLSPHLFTFPIDKLVCQMLVEEYKPC